MQVAASPFSTSIHSQYHPYYQLHAPGPQDHELKRQYLTLLPAAQIIEICLTFDAYVPPYAKTTIWPLDLNAAVAALRKSASDNADSVEKEKSLTGEVVKDVPAIMASLRSPEPQGNSSSQSESTPTTEPQISDEHSESTSAPIHATPSQAPTAASPPVVGKSPTSMNEPDSGITEGDRPKEAIPAEASVPVPPTPTPTTPQAQPQLAQSSQPVPLQPTYPHQAYNYGHPPGAYPHTPYYAGGYHYPYAFPTMQNGYPHQPLTPQPSAAFSPLQPSTYGIMPPPTHPHTQQHPEGMGMDDLPSYEEMIGEALMECNDLEGWAPKDLFNWMAGRYPLQSNFRPSASQALQKAFKRGRFEKSSNGKYRLSASWEGGSTSRRTTRRPQTMNGAVANPASMPPFTNAPLIHPQGRPLASQSLFTKQPLGFSQYSGYSTSQPRASTSTAPGTAAAAQAAVGSSSSSTINKPPSTENVAAYEAAQSILKAINFGGLLKIPTEQGKEDSSAPLLHPPQPQQPQVGDGVEHLLSHVQAALAGSMPPVPASATIQHTPVAPIEAHQDPRAELQAQLALLSAQLAELAQTEEVRIAAQPQPQPTIATAPPDPPLIPPVPFTTTTAIGPSMHSLSLPSQSGMAVISSSASTSTISGRRHPPSTHPEPTTAIASAASDPLLPQAEESDEDDDMEEII
ncbi:hypothetical protein CPB83DRAFT_902890 [Crepidotus variabilis]|uniref:Histone H1 n=1 Tax=Crepidotus variabilis TaxID=179855 RepID=A0A9P6ERV3_9AGAR|nr:hypothetical protein CPB83DRAFT_902890 [Crepidotus variabilis]